MALFDDNLTGFLQSQFGRRYGDEENPLLANDPIFKNWMDDLQFKRMSNVFANTLGGADTSRPAAPINPTDYGNITTAPMRPTAVIPVATPVATPAVAAMPAPALSESGLGTVARSVPPVWAQEMLKAKQAVDQPLNEGQKDALRYAALAKENAILDRQKRQDEANFDMYNPIAKVTQLHMMPHIPGTFGAGVMSSTPIFDNSKQRALEAERLQEGQTARDWGLQQLAMAQHRQNALEMAGVQHGYDMDKLRESLKGHLQQAQINNPAKVQHDAHMGQSYLQQLNNPNLSPEQVQAASKNAEAIGLLQPGQGEQIAKDALYNSIAMDANGNAMPIESSIARIANNGRMPRPQELEALYRYARSAGATKDRLQAIIDTTLENHGVGSLPTQFGTAQMTPVDPLSIGGLWSGLRSAAKSPVILGNKLVGMKAWNAPSNRVLLSQFLIKMLEDPNARKQFEQTYPGTRLP